MRKLQNFGTKVVGVTLTGDPKKVEKESFRIKFPWGAVDVTRAIDGVVNPDYWVHIYVNHPKSLNYCPDEDCGEFSGPGRITDARLDQTDKASTESALGDFNREELFHVAVRVGPKSETKP